MADPLLVLLRALTLAGQCGLVGGAVFALAVAGQDARTRPLRLAGVAALAAVLSSAIGLILMLRQMIVALDLSMAEALGAEFVGRHAAFMAAAMLAVLACALRRPRPWLALTAALTVVALSVLGGHAASRLDGWLVAVSADFLHQAAAGAWLGGIPFLLLAVRSPDGGERIRLCRRFSRLAMASVAVLVLSALVLADLHVGGWAAMIGSDFGAMATVKAVMLAGLLLLGLGNLRSGPRLDQAPPLARLRAFAMAEIAVGGAVLVVAAALSMLPPSAGAPEQVSAPAKVLAWLMPDGLPRLTASVPTISGSAEDRAWAEVIHHWAGLVVLAMGALALLRRLPGGRWARHWPLLFLLIAIGILLLADPDSWPLGPHGFWGQAGDWNVPEHRLAALLVTGFGIMEWAVQTGRLSQIRAALVFPGACVLGGLLLLTHGHPSADAQAALPVHLTHMAIAVLAVAAGAGRWIELTADAASRRIAGWVWPQAFVLVGVVLILYREG